MKTLFVKLFLLSLIAFALCAETFAQNQLFPMSINRKDKTAFGAFQSETGETTQIIWKVGVNNFTLVELMASLTAHINANLQLAKVTLTGSAEPLVMHQLTPPEGYTTPPMTLYYQVQVPTAGGKVVKGILAISTADSNPFVSLSGTYLPYWQSDK